MLVRLHTPRLQRVWGLASVAIQRRQLSVVRVVLVERHGRHDLDVAHAVRPGAAVASDAAADAADADDERHRRHDDDIQAAQGLIAVFVPQPLGTLPSPTA